jgi:hypothetical protein
MKLSEKGIRLLFAGSLLFSIASETPFSAPSGALAHDSTERIHNSIDQAEDVFGSYGTISSESPYLTPVASGVELTSILTVGDEVRKMHKGDEVYRMVGIPDGLGAYDNGDGTITVLMNHELRSDRGIERAHGGAGAFVSRWKVRKTDLHVLSGEDLIRSVNVWDQTAASFVESPNEAFARFCAADLPQPSAFYNYNSGRGLDNGRIFMNGEENDDEGRGFAHVIMGWGNSKTYQLPHLGRFSWENSVASPFMQDKTIVMGMDDDGLTDSQVYVYIGMKQNHGDPVTRAGLMNGKLYGIKAGDAATPQTEDAAAGFGASTMTFSLIDLGDVAGMSGAQIEANGLTAGVSNFRRVEDGVWDLTNPNRFYFLTTANFNTASRLWSLTFSDITHPELGGKINLLLDGGDGVNTVRMMDNITVDSDGNVIIQEDPGNQAYLAKVWSYNRYTGMLTELAQHDPARFTPGVSDFTQDEESSGVIDVSSMFEGVPGYDTEQYRYFLLDVQAHTPEADPELLERGQLLMMKVRR